MNLEDAVLLGSTSKRAEKASIVSAMRGGGFAEGYGLNR